MTNPAWLNGFDPKNFVENYWQKKPMLIRNAFPNANQLITADDLAGLALENDVVSRIITQTFASDDDSVTASKDVPKSLWQVEHGPFHENSFSELGDSRWTLLVQHVDQIDPNINKLLQHFNFLPKWRLDDVMISYATDGGGVGPHFDYYDVFLIQGEGERRWRIGQKCSTESALDPDAPMKILEEFHTCEDWVTKCGDLLYIPARWAHWGEAINESITYSVGLRAPSHQEVVLDYAQEACIDLTDDLRYKDTQKTLAEKNSPKIPHSAITSLSETFKKIANNEQRLAEWFGKHMTGQNPGFLAEHPEAIDNLDKHSNVALSPFIKSAFSDIFSTPAEMRTFKRANLYVAGESYQCEYQFANALCNGRPVDVSTLDEESRNVLLALCQDGYLIAG